MPSMDMGKKGVNKEVRDKRSRVNILTIKIDVNLRVERNCRIYYFPVCQLLQRTTERRPEAVTGPKRFSKTENTLSRAIIVLVSISETSGTGQRGTCQH